MFDREKAVANWRDQMRAIGIQSPATLEELESHLREEMEQQVLSGASAEKAFESAGRKIGRMDLLKAEFAKMDGTEKPTHMERWVIGFMTIGVIIPCGLYVVLKNEMSLGWRLAGLANFAVLALAIFGWRRLNRVFPVIPNQPTRLAIGLALGGLGIAGMIIFTNFVLPHFELTEGQLGVIVLWGLTVMAAFGGIASGLEEAARKQHSTIN